MIIVINIIKVNVFVLCTLTVIIISTNMMSWGDGEVRWVDMQDMDGYGMLMVMMVMMRQTNSMKNSALEWHFVTFVTQMNVEHDDYKAW